MHNMKRLSENTAEEITFRIIKNKLTSITNGKKRKLVQNIYLVKQNV